MRFRIVDAAAPGTVSAGVTLAILAAGFCFVGYIATIAQLFVQPAAKQVATGSLIPEMTARAAGEAEIISLVATILYSGLLVLAGAMLGRRRRFALGLLTSVFAAFAGANFTIGLMFGALPLALALVAVVVAWSASSRRFLRGGSEDG